MNLTQIRAIDPAAVPTAELAELTATVALKAKQFKDALADCTSLEKELNKRADTEILGDHEKVETAFGVYSRTSRTNMVLPSAENGGKDAVLQHVVDQVNAGTPLDEAFAILSTSLKKTAFDDIENDADLPLGIGRSEQVTVKFNPKKV